MCIMELKLCVVLNLFALTVGAAISIDGELAKQTERTDLWPKAVKDSTAKLSGNEKIAQTELGARAVDNEEKRSASTSFFSDKLDKQTNGIVIESSAVNLEKSSAASILIRIEKSNFNTVARIGNENASLENNLENETIPTLICWEIECPDCSKLETPLRCFGRVSLTVTVRMIFFLVAIAFLACCVVIVNHKGKSMKQQTKEKIKLIEDIENGNHKIDEEGNCKQALNDHHLT